MRPRLYVSILLAALAACGNDPAKVSAAPSTVSPPKPVDTDPAKGPAVAGDPVAKPDPKAPPPPPPPPAAPNGHDFTTTGKELALVGACLDGPAPEGYSEQMVKRHCEVIKAAQAEYADHWVKQARVFFGEKVPAAASKKIVYPFSGGDLSTALTVYPDADEITTMSLEPAGDPRTLAALNDAATKPQGKSGKPSPQAKSALESALRTVQKELKFLYRVNFSNTLNMIDAMRSGALPTQLIFGLSALKVHGYEIVGLRYFTLDESGTIKYLTDEEVATAPDPMKGMDDRRLMEKRNRIFANSEVRFRKPGGKIQVHRHIQADLGDKNLKNDMRVVKHLESKGTVSAMTKAASYLLSWDSFSIMRNYLTGHVEWMVSDATGVAPKWGKPAGFEYETYGGFTAPHLDSGNGVAKDWRDEWSAQPKRPLKFRFGYYDKNTVDHLVIMRKKSS
jgi:hypothetical protein